MIADVEAEFRSALMARGLHPPRRLVTGRFGRCGSVERPSSQDGAYVLHMDPPRPAGSIMNFRDGQGWVKWRSGETLEPMSKAEVERRIASRLLEVRQRWAAAVERAKLEWEAAAPVTSHPYLVRKGVRSHGLRVSPRGALVVPAYDELKRLTTLEFIIEDGRKVFLPGGRKAGSWFWVTDSCVGSSPALLVSEGYATAASLYEATGYPCAVAFDCGNLGRVTSAIARGLPRSRVIVCADDDTWTPGNPGLKAAHATGQRVAVPVFSGARVNGDTDFNDLARLEGPEAVRACVEGAMR